MNLQEKYLRWAFFLDLFGVFGKDLGQMRVATRKKTLLYRYHISMEQKESCKDLLAGSSYAGFVLFT